MADASVRPARAEDAEDLARVQLATWRTAYGQVLPPAALALPATEVSAAWRAAVGQPPSGGQGVPRQVLVALERDDVVGLAASAPAGDPELDGDTTAEVTTLLVEPRWGRRGHGSRLLAALVDGWQAAGVRTAVAWVFEGDRASRSFLASAGWEPDGATRGLDPGPDGEVQRQLRLHVDVRA